MSAPAFRQCTRCVMDTSDPDIRFGPEGQCNHCTDYVTRISSLTYRGEESGWRLRELVERIKRDGRGKPYDCVIGISGGVDSTYVAYVAIQHGLRPLAVHMDNGWNTDTAVKNIKNLAKTLGMDYQSHVLDWEEFRDLQLAFFKASVPEIETPTDMAIPATLHLAAMEHGIRFIISGGNYATEGILPARWHYNQKDVKFLKAIHKRFGKRSLKTFPMFGFERETYCKLVKGIRFAYPLNLVPYSKSDAIRVLQEELGWKNYGGKHHESKITAFVQSYIHPKKFGIDYRKATLSTQICAGEVTRQEALAALEQPPFNEAEVARDTEYIAKKLGLTIREFEEILARPPKNYMDYPNDQRLLECIYSVYRKYFTHG